MTGRGWFFVELKALHVNLARVPLEPRKPCSEQVRKAAFFARLVLTD